MRLCFLLGLLGASYWVYWDRVSEGVLFHDHACPLGMIELAPAFVFGAGFVHDALLDAAFCECCLLPPH